MPKPDHLWKHLAIVFAAALGVYVAGFYWMEHRRTRLGPWQVVFVKEPDSAALIRISQSGLQITNVEIRFNSQTDLALTNARVEFLPGRTVPFPVPFGECVFMDPLFLPGTVTLDLFAHRVEMLPRILTIDGQGHNWESDCIIEVNPGP